MHGGSPELEPQPTSRQPTLSALVPVQQLKLRRCASLEEDVFRHSSVASSSPPDASSDTPDRSPPRYQVGPYNGGHTTASGKASISPSGRRLTGVDHNALEFKDLAWPPPRRSLSAVKQPSDSPSATLLDIPTVKPSTPRANPSVLIRKLRAQASPTKSSFSMPQPAHSLLAHSVRVQVDAVASSSKVQLPPNPLRTEDYAHVPPTVLKNIFPRPPSEFSLPVSAPEPRLPLITAPLQSRSLPEPSRVVHASSIHLPIPKLAPRSASPVTDVDPFLDSSPLRSKGKVVTIGHQSQRDRRKTFSTFSTSTAAPLAAAFARVPASEDQTLRRRRSLPNSRSTTFASNLRRIAADTSKDRKMRRLSSSDKSLLLSLGMQSFVESVAREYGFHQDVVKRVFEAAGSIELARETLKNMQRAALGALLDDAKSSSQGEETDADEESVDSESEGATVKQAHPLNALVSYDPTRYLRLHHYRPRVSQSGLRYVPTPPSLPSYNPPSRSRARQYIRLNDVGRASEAKQREAALASPRKSASPNLRASPSPSPKNAVVLAPLRDISSGSRETIVPSALERLAAESSPPPRVPRVIVHGGVTMLAGPSPPPPPVSEEAKESKTPSGDSYEVEQLLSEGFIDHDAELEDFDTELDAPDVEPEDSDPVVEVSDDADSARYFESDDADGSVFDGVDGVDECGAETEEEDQGDEDEDAMDADDDVARAMPAAGKLSVDVLSGESGSPPLENFRLSQLRLSQVGADVTQSGPNEEEEERIQQALLDGDFDFLQEIEEQYGDDYMDDRVFEFMTAVWEERFGESI
jgi:hypothetical protein